MSAKRVRIPPPMRKLTKAEIAADREEGIQYLAQRIYEERVRFDSDAYVAEDERNRIQQFAISSLFVAEAFFAAIDNRGKRK